MISSTEEFCKLDSLYHQRNLKKATLDRSLNLIVQFYKAYNDHEFSSLPAEELRALSVTCEALDYFNRLDEFVGCDNGYQKHEIYQWLIEGSSALETSIPLETEGNFSTEESLLLLCKIRLIVAVALNERYRHHEYIYGPESELGRLITFAEKWLRPKKKDDFQSQATYMDVMANLHFLHGKAARQAGEYIEAELSFYKSSSYLLNLALRYSSAYLIEDENSDNSTAKIRSKIRRIGVVDLARAWLYLAWGKISKANLYVQRAIQLLGPDDTLSKMLAESIQGIVLRIKSGHNPEHLDEAIRLLNKSYSSFLTGHIKVPRHSIRTLYELEIALILKGKLITALDNIEKVVGEKKYKDDYIKVVKDSRWQSQMFILCSRIARKDKDDDLEERLYELSDKLKGVYKLQGKESFATKPRTLRSRDLAIKFAKTALDIADQNNLRICKMDSLIALGEAYLYSNEKGHSKAIKTFKNCLELVKAPHGQSIDIGIDGSDFSAVSHLYLARIAVSNHQQAEAEREFQRYEQLPSVEHSWILELAKITRLEVQALIQRKIAIDFDESSTWHDLKLKLELEAIRKMIVEPQKKGARPQDLMNRLGLGKGAFYNLIHKFEENTSQPQDNEDMETH